MSRNDFVDLVVFLGELFLVSLVQPLTASLGQFTYEKNLLTIFLSHYIWKDIAKGDKTFFIICGMRIWYRNFVEVSEPSLLLR